MNVKEVGLTTRLDEPTFSVTGISNGVAPSAAVMWMLPFWVVVIPVGLTETVKLAGVAALVGGAILSQELPEVTDAVTVVEPDTVPIFNCCEGGVEPPTV